MSHAVTSGGDRPLQRGRDPIAQQRQPHAPADAPLKLRPDLEHLAPHVGLDGARLRRQRGHERAIGADGRAALHVAHQRAQRGNGVERQPPAQFPSGFVQARVVRVGVEAPDDLQIEAHSLDRVGERVLPEVARQEAAHRQLVEALDVGVAQVVIPLQVVAARRALRRCRRESSGVPAYSSTRPKLNG